MSKSDRKITKVEITFKDLNQYSNIYKVLSAKDPVFPKSRFGIIFLNFLETFADPVFTKYNKEVKSISIDNALVDKTTGELLMTPDRKDFKYDKNGLKNKLKEEDELYDKWENKKYTVEKMCLKDKMPKIDDEKMLEKLLKIVDLSA